MTLSGGYRIREQDNMILAISINLLENGVRNPLDNISGIETIGRLVCWANGLLFHNWIIIFFNMVINIMRLVWAYRTN